MVASSGARTFVRGCPEISKQDALDLILDLEGPANPESLKQVRAREATSEVKWLERVLEDHRSLRTCRHP